MKQKWKVPSIDPGRKARGVLGYTEEVIRDWRGGLDTQDLRQEDVTGGANVPESIGDRVNYMRMYSMYRASFPQMLNLFVSHRGRAQLRGGQRKITQNLAAAPTAVFRYANATSVFLVAAAGANVMAASDTGIYPLTLTSISTTLHPGRLRFASAYHTLYWADGTNPPQKWDGVNQYRLGIVAPAAAPTLAAGAAGLLDSSAEAGQNPYKHWVTFYNNVTGLESNPSPVSNSVELTLKQAQLTAIPISSDPQVTSRRIYRQGGTLVTQRLVGQINDNTTTSYTDNLADLAVGDILMSFVRLAPINTLRDFYLHKNRLFAIDPTQPGRIWFSSYGQLEYWPDFVSVEEIDGGYIDIDTDPRDPIIGFCEIGSILLIFRAQTIYTLYGDTWADFTPRRLAKLGCGAAGSIVACKDQVLYLGSDSQIWALDGSGAPTWLSRRIENLLNGIPHADLAGAAACYDNQRYILSIPRGAMDSPLVLAYDFREDTWTDLSDGQILGANGFYVEPGNDYSGLLMATKAGYLWTDGTAFNGIVSALGPDDGGGAFNVVLQTPAYEFEKPTWFKRARHLRIEGSCTPSDSTQPMVATVIAETEGTTPISVDYPLASGSGQLLNVDLHPALIGRKISVRIHGKVTACELDTLSLRYCFVRETR